MSKPTIQLLATIAYPLLVLLALRFLEPRWVALVVLGIAGVRWLTSSAEHAAGLSRTAAPMVLGVVIVLLGAAAWNDPLGLLLVPVLISLTLLVGFAHSLRSGPPVVERLARLQVPDLSEAEVAYCRRVTIVWCVFFVANGGVALALAVAGEIELWTLYTGLIAYLAMGLLFAAEFVYRHWKFRRYVGSVTDPILSRLFPPRSDLAGDASTASPARSAPASLRRPIDTLPARSFWADHFPGEPILPGILQLRAAIDLAREAVGAEHPLTSVERLKFIRPVRPGAPAEVVVEIEPEGAELATFRIECDGELAARGKLRFGERADRPAAVAPRAARLEAAPPVDALLPHRGQMVWLSRVVGHDPSGTSCEVDVEAAARFFPPPDGSTAVDASCALEWMAQCVSAHDGLERREVSAGPWAPRIGFLLGTNRLRLHRSAVDVDARVLVEVRHRWSGTEGLGAFDCRVHDELGEAIADARVSCLAAPAGSSGNR